MSDAKWEGTVTLPPLPPRRMKIGKNTVVQHLFLGAECRARILESEIKSHDLIRLDLRGPYSSLLLRWYGAHHQSSEIPSVVLGKGVNPENLPARIPLSWDEFGPLETYCSSPDEVLSSWTRQFRFREEDEQAEFKGLRIPQMGALHAIAAHFSVGKEFDAATVVLPTGTGKTETMLATLVYRRLSRVLVLVPTTTLRKQISDKFKTLGVLPDAQVVPRETAMPRVAVIDHGIQSVEEARALLKESNVFVALPNALEASSAEAVAVLIEGCSDLMVDEAHHIAAQTWDKVRERFKAKRILQFTATPFRRDGKRIDGKIIFNYKLGDAQAAGHYRPITLKAVEEYGDDEARDRAIAKAAVAILRRDRNELGLDHLLMARTANILRAEAIGVIYQELAPEMKPVVVYSGSGRTKTNQDAMASIQDRGPDGSRIVICVDMLGEGFDLPNLKVAALHDSHKSIAITLQFIGRFTRKGAEGKIGEATVVANIADPVTESKLSGLYSEGADWDQVIRRLSEAKIASEMRLQDVVFGLKESGDLSRRLSLWNLRPALSTQFFRTKCKEWDPRAYSSELPTNAESWFAYNEGEKVLVAVVRRAAMVSWGDYQNVLDTIYDILILKWDKANAVLAVHASDFDGLRSEEVAAAVSNDTAALVCGTPVFNVLNNVQLPLVKSLGSSRVGAISFTSYFGPNVTEGLATIEKSQSQLNNIGCLGYEDGERVLWGCTQKRGKIWQARSGTISDWMEWTTSTWTKVLTEDERGDNITRDFLRPQPLLGPHTSYPISAQWGEQAQMRHASSQAIQFGDAEVPLIMVDVDVSEVAADGAILLRLSAEDFSSEYRLTITGDGNPGYRHEHVGGPAINFRMSRQEAVPLEEYLMKDPFIVRYADGTFSYNCFHIATNIDAGLFDRGQLEAWDWTGIPLNRESMHKEGNRETIQYRCFERLSGEFDVIFNDDGHGEAADLVCFKDVDDETIRLTLVHCKGAHDGRISQDIRNLYVVCGQAQKNITAKHMGLHRLYQDLKRRQDAWTKVGASRFLKGDLKMLTFFKEKARRANVEFEVLLVQPGTSIATITDDGLRLLATTELFLKKTTEATFRVIVSP